MVLMSLLKFRTNHIRGKLIYIFKERKFIAMKKKIALIFICSLFTCIVFSQKYDKTKIALNKIISENNSDSLKAFSYIKLSIIARYEFDMDSSLVFTELALEKAKKSQIKSVVGQVYLAKGITYFHRTEYSKSLEYYNKAKKILEISKDKKGYASVLTNMANIYGEQNNLKKEIEYLLKALIINKEIKEYNNQCINLYNISLIYFKLGEYNTSLEYCEKINIVKKENNLKEYLNAYIDIQFGNIYKELGQTENAMLYFKKALKFSEENKSFQQQILTLIKIGKIHLENNEVFKAENSLLKALKTLESLKSVLETKPLIYITLAEVYLKKNEINKGIIYAEKGLAIAERQKRTGYENEAHSILFSLNNRKKSFKEALNHHIIFKKLSDSIANKESLTVVKNIETKYETQQKENQILSLENEAQKKEITLQKSKTKTNLAVVSIFLVIVGGGLYIRKRKKDQKMQLLETSVKSSEQEKKRIGKELHDGIAGGLMTLVHQTETKDVGLSHKLLNSYNQIRDLSHQLNNTSMHGELFMDRLFEIVPEDKVNQVFEVSIIPQYLTLEEPYSTHIYRIILELFTNNLKYANASKTTLNLSLEEDILTLIYADNGKGVSDFKKGNGLKSIDNRVTLLNGNLKIGIENGFDVTIQIPLKS